jgi:hypothetical protein
MATSSKSWQVLYIVLHHGQGHGRKNDSPINMGVRKEAHIPERLFKRAPLDAAAVTNRTFRRNMSTLLLYQNEHLCLKD